LSNAEALHGIGLDEITPANGEEALSAEGRFSPGIQQGKEKGTGEIMPSQPNASGGDK